MGVQTPAGWYADPSDARLQRWWDGVGWTDHTAPVVDVTAPLPGPAAEEVHAIAGSAADIAAAALRRERGLLSGRRALEDENAALRQALDAMGVSEREALRTEVARLRTEREAQARASQEELRRLQGELARARSQIVQTTEEAVLQEVGIYAYRHPLATAVAYKAQLQQVQERIKSMAKEGQAVIGATTWTVNNSASQGTRMIKDFSKLMLRAYNNEADNIVRTMRPYMLDAAVNRLDKARDTISRLGKTMQIEVTPTYHHWRLQELVLTADYLAKQAEEKEREREKKARLREEEKARREYEAEKARLQKEATHYTTALAALRASGDPKAAEFEAKVADLEAAIAGVEARAANIRAGYVYVISNVGAFGERMVKIGMTRRLEPMDRIRELGDASVPFRYDVHALIFSDDAVTLETFLHQSLAAQRVNMVNARREFFYATPPEVRDLLAGRTGEALLEFEERPLAEEYHQSLNARADEVGVSPG